MKKLLFTFIFALCSCLQGCTSIPEGARKMTLNIHGITIEKKDGDIGFLVDYSVSHASPQAMPVDETIITVSINGKLAGENRMTDDIMVESHKDVNFKTFVSANHLKGLSLASLNTPMLKIPAEAEVSLIVDGSDSNMASSFNVKKKYQGIINATAN